MSMGSEPEQPNNKVATPKQKNIFTEIAIPSHQISSRALKLLRGEYAQSFSTIDHQPEVRRHQETVQGFMTKKNESKKYFVDLAARPSKNSSTIVPAGQRQSPIKPAPIFRQASIWKNLQDKTTLVQQIEEASVMRNKHYQKSSSTRKENESVLMSDAQK